MGSHYAYAATNTASTYFEMYKDFGVGVTTITFDYYLHGGSGDDANFGMIDLKVRPRVTG